MLGGDRMSVLKKKGIGANGQFQNMHLAVFPLQLEFQKNVDKKTNFYFEKKYQIIGRLNREVPASKKGTKISVKSLDNILYFRLFSQKNIVYRWSAYHIHDSGQEEYIDCCAINLKDLVANFILPKKSQASRSNQSLINLSFGNQQVKLKFPKLGVILSIILLVSDDPRNIREDVQRKYFRDQYNFPQINLLKTDSSSGNIPLSSRQNNSFSVQHSRAIKKSSLEDMKSSLQLLKYQSKKNDSLKGKNSLEMGQLDYVIMSDQKLPSNVDAAIDDEFKQIKLQIQRAHKADPVVENKENIPETGTKDLQMDNQFKGGILKLESDQVEREKVDSKLEYEELLEAIEEVKSSKETMNLTHSPKFQSTHKSSQKDRQERPKYLNKPIKQQRQQKTQQEQASHVVEQKFTLKKAIIYAFVSLMLIIIGATIVKESFGKSKKSRRK